TETNKGIGFELVKQLATNHPTDLILLGSRNQQRGEEALAQLGSSLNVKVFLADASSKESIEQTKQEIQKKYVGHLDVLINNAGTAIRKSGLKTLKDIFNTNVYAVKQMNDAMSPLLRNSGRIVNVSIEAGAMSMKYCSQDLETKFLNPNLTGTKLEELFAPLFKATEEGNDPKMAGFDHIKSPSLEDFYLLYYCASKLGVNILTRLKVRDWDKKYSTKNATISAVCPGFCATDLNSKAQGARSPKLGADSILHGVYTENLENEQFWRDGSRLPLKSEE
ncbi:unnamed protein product, partial [Rotaria sp. Silwood2]